MAKKGQLATEINRELVDWAYANLKGVPKGDEDYEKMISGVAYNSVTPVLSKNRVDSTERSQDYGALRSRDYKTLDEFFDARREFLATIFGRVGKNAFVEAPFFVDYGYNISVGDNFYANFNCTFLDCSLIKIGSGVMLGPNVTITTAGHPLEAKQRVEELVEFSLPITIGDNVWLGSNVVVLPGVTIGDNAVVAAGAVVSKDVPANTVVAGVPARVIREIDQNEPVEDITTAS